MTGQQPLGKNAGVGPERTAKLRALAQLGELAALCDEVRAEREAERKAQREAERGDHRSRQPPPPPPVRPPASPAELIEYLAGLSGS